MVTTSTPLDELERMLEFNFVRAAENAALNALPWLGRGEKELADGAACDAIRGMFDRIDISGEVVIGEGIKDNAPGIFKGEQLGTWKPGTPHYHIALDPIDGTTNIADGAPNSIACIAAACPGEESEPALRDIPSFYMKKLACGPELAAADVLRLDATPAENIAAAARALGKRERDIVVLVMKRERHKQLYTEIRATGAALRMISDGDIAGVIAPAIPGSGVDLYMGIGGSPEAVLSSAALRCLGGQIQARMWPRDAAERAELEALDPRPELDRIFFTEDLAHGPNVIFCATGVSDSPLVRGVRRQGKWIVTHSVLMRAKSGSIRYIETLHDLDKKKIRLRSGGEVTL